MPFAPSNIMLSCSTFAHSQPIPRKHTADGENISPEFTWQGASDRTKSYALFCHDPDAPLVSPNGTYGFVHWLLYNIPVSVENIPEGVQDFTVGRNDADGEGYFGPKPPEGHGDHNYYFWVLALNVDDDLPAGLTLWEFLQKVEPNILGMSRIVGTYRRG